jgi:hypothetical protein
LLQTRVRNRALSILGSFPYRAPLRGELQPCHALDELIAVGALHVLGHDCEPTTNVSADFGEPKRTQFERSQRETHDNHEKKNAYAANYTGGDELDCTGSPE